MVIGQQYPLAIERHHLRTRCLGVGTPGPFIVAVLGALLIAAASAGTGAIAPTGSARPRLKAQAEEARRTVAELRRIWPPAGICPCGWWFL